MNHSLRALLTSTLLLVASNSTALPLSNDSDWKKYFPDTKLDDPAISEKIKRYKKSKSPDPQAAKELAQIGLPVLPYAMHIAGIRRSRFQFAFTAKYVGPHFAIERPYSSHARLIFDGISDPNARPIFLKLVDHRQLRDSAKSALVRMPEAVDSETILRMIANEGVKLYLLYDYKRIYSPLIKRLDSRERAHILTSIVNSSAVRFCLDSRGHADDGLHDGLNQLISDLGETRSGSVQPKLKHMLAILQEPRELDGQSAGVGILIERREQEIARVARVRENILKAIAATSQNKETGNFPPN